VDRRPIPKNIQLIGLSDWKVNHPWIGKQDTSPVPAFYRITQFDSPQKKYLKLEKLKYLAAGEDGAPPFRYIGRLLSGAPIRDTDYDEVPGRYLSMPLTALGYGGLTFASFYPNCRGVFGFWDDISDLSSDTTYQVIGEYTQSSSFLTIFIIDFANRIVPQIKADTTADTLVDALNDAIKNHFGWELDLSDYINEVKASLVGRLDKFQKIRALKEPEALKEAMNMITEAFTDARTFPGDSFFVAKVTIAPSLTSAPPEDELELTIGQTGTEALSTFLGSKLAGSPSVENQQRLVEDFLESLQFSAQLEHLEVDVGATFKELRHQKGFKAYAGGTLWRIRKAPKPNAPHQQDISDQQVTLPDEISGPLNEINRAQMDYDRLVWRIESRRKQLYADWTKYMVSQYPPDVWEADYPDIDEMRFFLEQAGRSPLKALNEALLLQKKEVLKLQEELTGILADVQKIRNEDITNWEDFSVQIDPIIKVEKTYWSTEDKQTLIGKLNHLLELGGVFSHRPKEHFIGNRPAWDQPLLVEDFPDWSALISGLQALEELLERTRKKKSLEKFIDDSKDPYDPKDVDEIDLNDVLREAGVIIQIFPTTLGGKTEKYIQPLEIDELSKPDKDTDILDLLVQATEELFEATKAGKVNVQSASYRNEVVRRLNEILIEPSPGLHEPITSGQKKEYLTLKRKQEQQGISKNEHYRFNRLALEQLLPALKNRPAFELQHKGNSRFYQPTEPVVLLAGDPATANPRHGQDGRLGCARVRITQETTISEQANNSFPAPHPVFGKIQPPKSQQYPLLMDWQVEYYPDSVHINRNVQQSGYAPDYLVSRHQVDPEGPDLQLKDASDASYAVGSHSYWGSTVLTPGAQNHLKNTLERFIKHELKQLPDLPQELKEKLQAEEVDGEDPTGLNFDQLFKWYFSKSDNQFFQAVDQPLEIDPAALYATIIGDHHPANLDDAQDRTTWKLITALLARKLMDDHPVLSQSLGGFNDALLMLKRGFQLPVKDPLGFPEYQRFTQEIGKAIGRLNFSSILPHNAFFPLRSGSAKLSDLRLLDTFGREVLRLSEIHQRKLLASETMQPERTEYNVSLKPRFTQPARLDFKWLSALDDELEMNDHPASSPICGWILLNEMDETLLVYNQGGKALGYIDSGGEWRVFPGHAGPVLPEGIGNAHLRRLVNWICSQAKKEGQPGAFDQFFGHLNTALDNIEPDHGVHHQSISLLMSQPLALVRASVQLELKGERVLHQGWDELKGDLKTLLTEGKVDRQSLNYEQVKVPFRLGEHQKLNDGLVAYWIDEADGESYRNDDYYTPVKPDPQTDLVLEARSSDSIGQSPGLHLNLLMDPRGALHATCGLLPTASLRIPPDQYAEAVKKIEVIFLTAPLITHRGQVQLSLPEEPGYHWSWLAKADNRWSEITTHGHLQKSDLALEFGDQAASLWNALVNNGVLKPTGGDLAVIQNISSDDPTNNTLWKDIPKKLVPKLQLYLGSRQITSFQHSAAFSGPQEIREGWLKLQPDAKEDKA
jgi:hypothetical protein